MCVLFYELNSNFHNLGVVSSKKNSFQYFCQSTQHKWLFLFFKTLKLYPCKKGRRKKALLYVYTVSIRYCIFQRHSDVKKVSAFVSLVVIRLQRPRLVGAPLRALVPVRADLRVPVRLHPLPAQALEAEPAGRVLFDLKTSP